MAGRSSRDGLAAGLAGLAVALLGVTLSLPAVAAFAGAGRAGQLLGCAVPGQISASAGWLRSLAPTFDTGGAGLAGYAVAPSTPREMLVTNGREIEVSTDFGCHWSPVFRTPALPSASYPFSSATATITSLSIGWSGRFYAVLTDPGHPHVLISADQGQHWQTGDQGILATDPTATPPLLVAAPSPSYLYLVVHDAPAVAQAGAALPAAAADILYVSTDGGSSWNPTTPAASLATSNPSLPQINDLAVDPDDPQDLWAATSAGLLSSQNAGGSWTQAQVGGGDPMAVVNVFARPGQPAGVTAYDAAQPLAYQSLDAGSTWTSIATPSIATSAALISSTQDAAMAGGGAVQRLAPATLRWSSIWSGAPTLSGLSADIAQPAQLHACSCGQSPGAVWTYTGAAPGSPPYYLPPLLPPAPPASKNSTSSCMPSAPPIGTAKQWPQSVLSPPSQRIALASGQSLRVAYRLDLAPEEMDVYFLGDTGPTSEFSYCPFKWGVIATVAGLDQARNARVGLGDFGDYPNPNANNATFAPSTATSYVYARDAALQVPGAAFAAAVANMSTNTEDGTPTGDQASYAALWQAATGIGQLNPVPLAPPYIPAGLQAGFASDSFNVVMHVVGNWFNSPQRSPGYPGPSRDTALAALLADHIHVAGVWVNNQYNKQSSFSSGGSPDGSLDLRDMVTATGSLSPVPIDCQGDGIITITPGAPLECTYFAPPEGDFGSRDPILGQEMLKLLLAYRDPEPVSLRPIAGGSAVTAITPADHPGVDLLLPQVLDYQVTYHCGLGQTGGSQLVQLGAYAGSRLAATAQTTLVCGVPLASPRHLPVIVAPPPPPPVTQALANPNPNPNPGQAPAAEPAPNPAQAPQAQAQAQAQGVVVQQKQSQPQLSFVQAAQQLQADTAGQDAMVAARPASNPALMGGAVAGGAGGLCIAVMCALRRARSPALSGRGGAGRAGGFRRQE